MRWIQTLLAVLLLVPCWAGEERLPLIAPDARVLARGYVPPGGWPVRFGALAPIGALVLDSPDRHVGGFSALALRGDEMVLLNDGGQIVRLAVVGNRLERRAIVTLRDGPGSGWGRKDRDSESLVLDHATGRAWIGFERVNAIWRYGPDLAHAEAHVAPRAMWDWGNNTGPESMVRLGDGRFLVLQEGWQRMAGPRAARLFDGDPTVPGTAEHALLYRPPPGYCPSDAAILPDGDVLVLNRRWRFPPLRFDTLVVRISRDAIRPGATLRGRVVADISAAVGHGNAEGIAVTRERGATVVWVVTDNDTSRWRPTLLAKFRWLG